MRIASASPTLLERSLSDIVLTSLASDSPRLDGVAIYNSFVQRKMRKAVCITRRLRSNIRALEDRRCTIATCAVGYNAWIRSANSASSKEPTGIRRSAQQLKLRLN